MPSDRLRSIVPMFGGATQYATTLMSILEFVESYQPTTDELVAWHRETFANVSSRSSIMRRVGYLRNVGFLQETDEQWGLGPAGRTYRTEPDSETLLGIMSDRNVGLRSLLYSLSVAPMTISEVSDQQFDTHPELGWSRGETDMALQRVNWLRSMGFVRKRGDEYELTADGRTVTEKAVKEWAPGEGDTTESAEGMTATTYETVTSTRALDPEFRQTALTRYDYECPVSGVDHADLPELRR